MPPEFDYKFDSLISDHTSDKVDLIVPDPFDSYLKPYENEKYAESYEPISSDLDSLDVGKLLTGDVIQDYMEKISSGHNVFILSFA